MSTWIAAVSTLAAVVSCAASAWAIALARQATAAAAREAAAAQEANAHAKQLGQSEAVIHFTGRFFDLLIAGRRFDDPAWVYQFWSLHATEFYFFHHGWIPEFMYQLWMVELASTYCEAAQIRTSHQQYLSNYSNNYPEMCEFFRRIREIAMDHRGDLASRNRMVQEHVKSWPLQTSAPVTAVEP
jgi:hypothetical protein